MELNQILDALYARHQERQPEAVPHVFAPPAAPEDIAAAETALGMPLPDELRALYARHAYMCNVWGDVSIDPVRSLAKSRRILESVASNMAEDAAQNDAPAAGPILTASGPVAPLVYVPSRIPFASENGRDLLVDLDPPGDGTPGQIVRMDIEFGTIEVVATSLTEFFAHGLEAFDAEASGEPGWLAAQALRLLGPLVTLAMTAFSLLVVLGVIAWGGFSVAVEGITGLFRRKQE